MVKPARAARLLFGSTGSPGRAPKAKAPPSSSAQPMPMQAVPAHLLLLLLLLLPSSRLAPRAPSSSSSAAGGIFSVLSSPGSCWGAHWTPPRSQVQVPSDVSSKEHIQLGWVVRWVLSSPPRATPRLGGVYVSCQCPPCSFVLCTRPARARPSVGGQSPTPAPRQLPWGPPRGWCSGPALAGCRTRISAATRSSKPVCS
jgi:hypothetical protein